MNTKRIYKILTVIIGAVTIITALYIMAHGLGLQEELDFGAGAYYYADIPEFQKYTDAASFSAGLPYWVYVILFLAWGVLMFLLWKYIDKK